MDKITSFYRSDRRDLSLRIVSTIFALVGAVLMLIGMLLLYFGVSALLSDVPPAPPRAAEPFAAGQASVLPFGARPGATLFLIWAFASLLSGLQSVALATLFRLAIQVEENTRASAQFLDKIGRRLESSGEAVGPLFQA